MSHAVHQVLVTGANRGIGLELVRQYAASGWRVIACCRNSLSATTLHGLTLSSGGRVTVHELDVADFSQIERLAMGLQDQAIDLLINNAGYYPQGACGDINYVDWEQAFRVNTMAPMRMVECLVEQVARSNLRKIATLTSKMGSMADNSSGGSYPYRTSKAATNMVMKSLAIDLQSRGISVATLHPGWVKTEMGGPNALISTEQSVSGMRAVIDQMSVGNSGRFMAYDGQEIPW